MPVRLKNNSRGLLAATITALDTVVRVRVGQGERFPSLGADEWFPLALEDDQGNVEITKAVMRSGDAITVKRGQDGTEARQFNAGAIVSLRLTRNALSSYINGEDPPEEGGIDPDYGGAGLIFSGLVADSYHNEDVPPGYFHTNSGTAEGHFIFGRACYSAARAVQDFIDDHKGQVEPMTVTGDLAEYTPAAAYEGRLAINHSIGTCSVEQIDGDELPPGSRIRVDQYSKQVVIDWPAYAVLPGDPMFNGDFERGDLGWIKGPGWTIETVGNGNDGKGIYVGVYRGYGENVMEQEAYTDCAPNARIPVRVNVQQGASRAGNCGAGIGMRFYDTNKALISQQNGNQIWSGAKARWHYSNLDSVAPAGTKFVRAIIIGGRKSENHPMWVDDAWWSMPVTIGTQDEDREFRLKLLVRDASGQEAIWEGQIGERRIYITSKPYPLMVREDFFAISSYFVAASSKSIYVGTIVPPDNFKYSAYFDSASSRSTQVGFTQKPEDFFTLSAYLVSASSREVNKKFIQQPEDFFTIAAKFTSASSKVVLVSNTMQPEGFQYSAYFVGASSNVP